MKMEPLSYAWSVYSFLMVLAAGYWIRSQNVALLFSGAIGLLLLAADSLFNASSSPWLIVFRINLVIVVVLCSYFARPIRDRLSRSSP